MRRTRAETTLQSSSFSGFPAPSTFIARCRSPLVSVPSVFVRIPLVVRAGPSGRFAGQHPALRPHPVEVRLTHECGPGNSESRDENIVCCAWRSSALAGNSGDTCGIVAAQFGIGTDASVVFRTEDPRSARLAVVGGEHAVDRRHELFGREWLLQKSVRRRE